MSATVVIRGPKPVFTSLRAYVLLQLWSFGHLRSVERVVSSRKPGRAWNSTMKRSGFIIVLHVDKMELSQRAGTF